MIFLNHFTGGVFMCVVLCRVYYALCLIIIMSTTYIYMYVCLFTTKQSLLRTEKQ